MAVAEVKLDATQRDRRRFKGTKDDRRVEECIETANIITAKQQSG